MYAKIPYLPGAWPCRGVRQVVLLMHEHVTTTLGPTSSFTTGTPHPHASVNRNACWMQTTACAQLPALSMKTKSPTILGDCCQAHTNRDGAQHKQGPDSTCRSTPCLQSPVERDTRN